MDQEKLLKKYSKMMTEQLKELKQELKSDYENGTVLLSQEIKNLKETNDALRSELRSVREELKIFKNRTEYLELHVRKKNLIVRGLEINEDSPDVVLSNFFKNTLKISEPIPIDSSIVFRHTSPKKTILVTFMSEKEKMKVLDKVIELKINYKTHGCNVTRDLPPQMRLRKNKLLQIRAEIRKNITDAAVTVKNDALILNGSTYTWDEKYGLQDQSGNAVKTLLNVDLNQRIEELLSENSTRPRNVNTKPGTARNTNATKPPSTSKKQ